MSTPTRAPDPLVRPSDPITSSHTGDPDMAELIQLFVEEIPERVRAVRECWERHELAELARISHQLKGASGGYGFPAVGDAAANLERHLLAPAPSADSVSAHVHALIDLCARVRVA